MTEFALPIEGFMPDAPSKSLILKEGDNQMQFVYRLPVARSYTVRYRDVADTDLQLLPDERREGTMSAVAERAPEIAGYAVDEGYKSLVLSSDPAENVITFYYHRNLPGGYAVRHHLQCADGQHYVLDSAAAEAGSAIPGARITGADMAKAFPGYALNLERSTPFATVTSGGEAVLELYYDRLAVNVTIHHCAYIVGGPNKGPTANALLPDEIVRVRWGQSVTAEYRAVDGYEPILTESQGRTITARWAKDAEIEPNHIELYYAQGEAATAGYDVIHFRQAPDGSYPASLSERARLTGYVGQQAAYAPRTREDAGYARHSYAPGQTQSEPAGFAVNGQGSLLIRLCYALDEANYLVRHHRLDAYGRDIPALMEEEPFKRGPIGAAAAFAWRPYPGYEPVRRAPEGEVVILPGGQLVVELYYGPKAPAPGPTPTPEPTPALEPPPTPAPSLAPTASATPARTAFGTNCPPRRPAGKPRLIRRPRPRLPSRPIRWAMVR